MLSESNLMDIMQSTSSTTNETGLVNYSFTVVCSSHLHTQKWQKSAHPPAAQSPSLKLSLPLFFITSVLTYLSNNAICLLPSGFHPPLCLHWAPLPFPPFFLAMDDTGSPCSNFTLSSWHPLKWRWALGPRWPNITLAHGPLNANKGRRWIIDTSTTNEETLSQLFFFQTHILTYKWLRK